MGWALTLRGYVDKPRERLAHGLPLARLCTRGEAPPEHHRPRQLLLAAEAAALVEPQLQELTKPLDARPALDVRVLAGEDGRVE